MFSVFMTNHAANIYISSFVCFKDNSIIYYFDLLSFLIEILPTERTIRNRNTRTFHKKHPNMIFFLLCDFILVFVFFAFMNSHGLNPVNGARTIAAIFLKSSYSSLLANLTDFENSGSCIIP